MKLRKYKQTDCAEIATLFYNTVHAVNAQDYTKAQLDAWATGEIDISVWDKTFSEHNTLIAEDAGIIVGFGDMDGNGYLDKLFIHKDYQNRGIATAILNELECQALLHNIFRFTTHASITAKPFFERCGYKTLTKNIVVRQGIELTNFTMEKHCTKER